MPVLLWVAFWSLMMGGTACFGETPRPARAPAPKTLKARDLSGGDQRAIVSDCIDWRRHFD